VLSVHSGSGSSFFFSFLLFVRVGYAGRFGHTIPRYVYIARSLFACRFLGLGYFLSFLLFLIAFLLRQSLPRERRRGSILHMHLTYIANITLQNYEPEILFYLSYLTTQPASPPSFASRRDIRIHRDT
jgi:hypothetical protein